MTPGRHVPASAGLNAMRKFSRQTLLAGLAALGMSGPSQADGLDAGQKAFADHQVSAQTNAPQQQDGFNNVAIKRIHVDDHIKVNPMYVDKDMAGDLVAEAEEVRPGNSSFFIVNHEAVATDIHGALQAATSGMDVSPEDMPDAEHIQNYANDITADFIHGKHPSAFAIEVPLKNNHFTFCVPPSTPFYITGDEMTLAKANMRLGQGHVLDTSVSRQARSDFVNDHEDAHCFLNDPETFPNASDLPEWAHEGWADLYASARYLQNYGDDGGLEDILAPRELAAFSKGAEAHTDKRHVVTPVLKKGSPILKQALDEGSLQGMSKKEVMQFLNDEIFSKPDVMHELEERYNEKNEAYKVINPYMTEGRDSQAFKDAMAETPLNIATINTHVAEYDIAKNQIIASPEEDTKQAQLESYQRSVEELADGLSPEKAYVAVVYNQYQIEKELKYLEQAEQDAFLQQPHFSGVSNQEALSVLAEVRGQMEQNREQQKQTSPEPAPDMDLSM